MGRPVMTGSSVDEVEAVRSTGQHQMWTELAGLKPDTIYCYEVHNGSLLRERTGFSHGTRRAGAPGPGSLAFGGLRRRTTPISTRCSIRCTNPAVTR